jgi:hypothetical protein
MMMPKTEIGKKVQSLVAVSALALMTACAPNMPTTTTGPKVDISKPVPVALLVPLSSEGTAQIATDLENAARRLSSGPMHLPQLSFGLSCQFRS